MRGVLKMKLGVSVVFTYALMSFGAIAAYADDSEIILDKARTLTDMQYRAEKLKVQADMAQSYDKMIKSGVVVSEEGIPLGVGSIGQLAQEVQARNNSAPKSTNPFDTTGPQFSLGGTEPQAQVAPTAAPVAAAPVSAKAAKEEETALAGPVKGDRLRLIEIRANYIMLQSGMERTKLSLGQTVNGYKLMKISGDTADLLKDGKTTQLAIRW